MTQGHPHCTAELPQGYEEYYRLDLQKDKKTALIVNALSIVLALALVVVGNLFVPLSLLSGDGLSWPQLLTLSVGIVAYLALHEAVHGIVMRAYGAPKVRYGFTGMYAFAGSDAFFDKTSYLVIALAPVVVWGVVLLALCLVVDAGWFWVAYAIQVLNLSGAAGDAYVTVKFSRFPADIWVRDSGVSMVVYARGGRAL